MGSRTREPKLSAKNPNLGDLEQLVLLAVLQLGGNAYAVSVRQEIEDRCGRSLTRGAVYVTLDRLQSKGYVTSRLGASTPKRGGKPKRLFKIRKRGLVALQHSLEEVRLMQRGLVYDLSRGVRGNP